MVEKVKKKKKTTKNKTRRSTTKKTKLSNSKIKAIKSSKKQIKKSIKQSDKKIRKSLGENNYIKLVDITKRFKDGKDSKSFNSVKGKYTTSRKKLHSKIINKFLSMDKANKNPDLYVLGGVAASGKTSKLQKFIKEPVVIINNDDIKSELAKVTKSPIKGKKLAHAALLHREAQDIEKLLVKKARLQKKDVLLDRTLGNLKKNLSIINKYRSKGYDVQTYGTNLAPHIAIKRATKRFLKSGRFVPLTVIGAKGNTINNNVLAIAMRGFNKRSRVVDTRNFKKPRVVFKKD